MKNTVLLTLVLLLTILAASAQLTIDFPINNAVYQRSNANQLNLLIAGEYRDTTATTLQARLLNPQTNAVIPNFDWTTISNAPTLGHFRGFLINVPGGWYKLQVRTLNNQVVISSAEVSHVGIGEVFVVSGQSNAEGFLGLGAVSALSEKVRTHSYDDSTAYGQHTFNKPEFPSSSKIEYNSFLSYKGRSAWAYGRLGDLLTIRLGVPIAFFNGAAIGTSSKNWRESSLGLSTQNEYTGTQYGILGMPYGHLKIVLNYYANQFGTRANLWHQGETDTSKGVSTDDYVANMNVVRSQSRADFNPNLSWMVSRATFDGNITSSQVRGGQNILSQQDTNTFYGPETDLIKNRTPDSVHFQGPSLIQLANEWDVRLDSGFFAASKPVAPKPIQQVKLSYVGNEVWMVPENTFATYRWIKIVGGNKNYENTPESTSALLKKSSGQYICYLTENNGNIIPSQIIDVDLVKQFYAKNPPVCENEVFLSDITTARDGLKLDISQNNGSLLIDGQSFAKGLGSHAAITIPYTFPVGTYSRFKSYIGIDDTITSANCPSNDGVIYKVFGVDSVNALYVSGLILPETPIKYIDLDISGQSKLVLVVEKVGNMNCDHANWGDAKFTGTALAPPVITANRTKINVGQTVKLTTTTACPAGNTLRWSDGVRQATHTFSPPASNEYFATCVSPGNCQSVPSNKILVSVIPDCAGNFVLTSPTDNLDKASTDLIYKVSTTIEASNKLSTGVRATLDAKKSILLKPGFTAESGTTFTAKIGGCTN